MHESKVIWTCTALLLPISSTVPEFSKVRVQTLCREELRICQAFKKAEIKTGSSQLSYRLRKTRTPLDTTQL